MARHYVSLAASIVFNAASLVLLRQVAVTHLGGDLTLDRLPALLRVLVHPTFLGALVLFGMAFVTWMYALARIDLSLAYPTVSASYVLIALASRALFNETITTNRWLGMAVIVAGIVIMYRR